MNLSNNALYLLALEMSIFTYQKRPTLENLQRWQYAEDALAKELKISKEELMEMRTKL